MSVGRQFNWQGQMRIDVPHLRAVESSIAYDFDTLAGQALGGGSPYILKGFTIASTPMGVLPETLQLVTAGSVMFNYLASENGTMLFVPANRAPETLAITNSRVSGGFTASQINYISIDYTREADPSTADVVQFLDATTLATTPKTIPLGRTLDYKIYISTTPFSGTPNRCPIAKVTVDVNGFVSAIEDARTMYFRLALGGDIPNPLYPFTWAEGRAPEDTSLFTGGDKAITDEKQWKSAIMGRLWEVTGGEYWYSDVTDRNVKFYSTTASSLSIAATAVTWVNLRVSLDNSTAKTNVILDGTIDLVDDNGVVYVEVDRSVDNANLTPVYVTAAAYNALAPPVRPGSRYILFWRKGALVYSRLDYQPIGVFSGAATTLLYGVVKTNTDEGVVGGPYAVAADALGGRAVASGLTRGSLVSGVLAIGSGARDGSILIGKATINFLVSDSAADNFMVASLGGKSSGTLGKWKVGASTVAQIPWNGIPTIGEDVLLRSYVGWGQGIITDATITGFIIQTTASGMPFDSYTSDGINIV